MDYFRVKNWEHYQHYSKRNPPWIKLYTSVLDNYEFARLPDTAKWQWMGILMLAAKTGNRMPVDTAWLKEKLGCYESVDLQPFVALDFIEPWVASKLLAQGASVSRGEEKEIKRGPDDQKVVHRNFEDLRQAIAADGKRRAVPK